MQCKMEPPSIQIICTTLIKKTKHRNKTHNIGVPGGDTSVGDGVWLGPELLSPPWCLLDLWGLGRRGRLGMRRPMYDSDLWEAAGRASVGEH